MTLRLVFFVIHLWQNFYEDPISSVHVNLQTDVRSCHTTLDPAVLWTHSNDISRLICSDSVNPMPSAPLYLQTLWRYTNTVIIIIITKRQTIATLPVITLRPGGAKYLSKLL